MNNRINKKKKTFIVGILGGGNVVIPPSTLNIYNMMISIAGSINEIIIYVIINGIKAI